MQAYYVLVGADANAVVALAQAQGLTIVGQIYSFGAFSSLDDGGFGNLGYLNTNQQGAVALAR